MKELRGRVAVVTGAASRSILQPGHPAARSGDEQVAEWLSTTPLVLNVRPTGPAITLLRGSLAPGGAVIKRAGTDPRLLRHTGPAHVFDGLEDLFSRIDDEDMLRISDARMSGTASGACVLHVVPEAAVGGPLADKGCDFDFLIGAD
jgi:dihydroxyacid dehydratase/phosphogluconate dehydratase